MQLKTPRTCGAFFPGNEKFVRATNWINTPMHQGTAQRTYPEMPDWPGLLKDSSRCDPILPSCNADRYMMNVKVTGSTIASENLAWVGITPRNRKPHHLPVPRLLSLAQGNSQAPALDEIRSQAILSISYAPFAGVDRRRC